MNWRPFLLSYCYYGFRQDGYSRISWVLRAYWDSPSFLCGWIVLISDIWWWSYLWRNYRGPFRRPWSCCSWSISSAGRLPVPALSRIICCRSPPFSTSLGCSSRLLQARTSHFRVVIREIPCASAHFIVFKTKDASSGAWKALGWFQISLTLEER